MQTRVLFINVADMREVPAAYADYVKLVLRRIDHKNFEEEAAEYARRFSVCP